ncbi:TniQ family protein [Rhodocyclus tenuis]|uniref:TniQ domain-containing protein n=1 Tax=Rhodocyclus tenuis TaxID=1066 RepID=A0A840G042_RHOTE|nr:TniQ family protein [Rhodocyclus tenuis]MBB4245843.1 hypothetical protein [Rhodocyclus tenuis]
MWRDIRALPIRVPFVDSESGLGFLLRAFSANGVSLLKARELFSIKDWRLLTPEQAAALSRATNAEPHWLAERLLMRDAQTPERFKYFGQLFGGHAAYANISAKVCPDCLRKKRWCHRVWILPGAAYCYVHGRPLIDSCRRCTKTISWLRPSIDLCKCGRYLEGDLSIGAWQAMPLASAWTQWLDLRLDTTRTSESNNIAGIPPFLNNLSIDGSTSLVLAFGEHERPDDSVSSPRKVTPSKLSAKIQRGIERLASIDGAPHEARRWSPYVHTPTLEKMKRSGITSADRRCAALLLSYVGRRSPRCHGGKQQRGQLELFF